jgi:hypothetical protein
VFNFYLIMKRAAATAALGALAAVAMLQPAMAQGGGAAPAKAYKDGEYELYDASLKAVAGQNFAKAITDLGTWKTKVPQSDYADERTVLLIQAYGGAKQFDKALAEAGPMLSKDLDKTFPDPKSGPQQVLAVLLGASVAIQNIPSPNPEQLATAEKAATMLKSYSRKPEGVADAAWAQAKDQLQKAADGALMYVAVVPGSAALQKNDCETAQNLLSRAVGAYPNNAYIAYQLGQAYRCTVKATPAKADEFQPKAIYQFIRAMVIDPSLGGTQDPKKMGDMLNNTYVNYHGDSDGLDQLKASVKANALPPADFTIESGTKAAERKQKEFEAKYPQLAMWLGIKGQLAGEGGTQYFQSQLKDAAVPKLKGNVMEGKPACRSKELLVSVPEPNQQNAPAVITLKLDAPLTGKPEAGEIQWEGVPSAFTSDPFMLTMDTEKAKISDLKVTPCTAAPASKKGASPKKK